MNYELFVWLAVLIICLAVEVATMGLTSIWFAAGALVSMLLSLFHAPVWVQIAVFVAVSVPLMLAVRPVAAKFFNNKRIKTNVEEVPGKTGIVSETINNLEGTGRVTLEGKDWMARCESDGESPIEKDAHVEVVSVQGVKLIVRKKS